MSSWEILFLKNNTHCSLSIYNRFSSWCEWKIQNIELSELCHATQWPCCALSCVLTMLLVLCSHVFWLCYLCCALWCVLTMLLVLCSLVCFDYATCVVLSDVFWLCILVLCSLMCFDYAFLCCALSCVLTMLLVLCSLMCFDYAFLCCALSCVLTMLLVLCSLMCFDYATCVEGKNNTYKFIKSIIKVIFSLTSNCCS